MHLMWAAVATLLAAGCAAKGPVKGPEVVWPLPPEKPRVRFVKSISGSADVEKKRGAGLLARLSGADTSTGFSKPYGMHVDREGRLFVADTGWRKVLVFDFANESFWILGVDGLGALAHPVGVSSDDQGNIYVADASQLRVVVYDRDGNYLNAFGGRDYIVKPVGVAVDSVRKQVYVVDTKAHQVVTFDTDGNFIRNFGSHGPQDGAFNWPTNVSVGPKGNVYVVDMLNFRVQVFNPDGEFLWKFGGVGRGFGQFSKPKGLGINSTGQIFVSDAAFNNVQIFDPQGRLLLFFGGMGHGPGQFWMPGGLAVGQDDRIYVADQFHRQVNVYELIRYPDEETGSVTVQQPAMEEVTEEVPIDGVMTDDRKMPVEDAVPAE